MRHACAVQVRSPFGYISFCAHVTRERPYDVQITLRGRPGNSEVTSTRRPIYADPWLFLAKLCNGEEHTGLLA